MHGCGEGHFTENILATCWKNKFNYKCGCGHSMHIIKTHFLMVIKYVMESIASIDSILFSSVLYTSVYHRMEIRFGSTNSNYLLSKILCICRAN